MLLLPTGKLFAEAPAASVKHREVLVRCAHDQSPYEQRRSSSSGTRYSEAVSSTHQRLPGRTGPSLSAASDTRPQLDVDRRRHSSRARPVPTSPAAAGRLRVTRQSAARRRRRWHHSRPRLLRRLQSVVQVFLRTV